jgi:uncharacterized membrane protein YeaQ/YmgE (transglycosylase-associated protein family)
MSLIVYLILLAVMGVIIGGLARLALPGRDPMSLWETMAVGILGSLIAGIVTWAVWGRGAGFFLSFCVSTGLVYLIRRSRGGSLTDPGRPPLRR